jgi:hypothetical protein
MLSTPNSDVSQDSRKAIAEIIGNASLASSIHDAITSALARSFAHVGAGNTAWEVFERSLSAAIGDIETHPRSNHFRRLFEYGPQHPDEPETLSSDGQTILSDPELGKCIEFIYSHMINRFKGELAELLALEPCCSLVARLNHETKLPNGTQLYWGETIQERRYWTRTGTLEKGYWGGFTKGADGLLVEPIPSRRNTAQCPLVVHGVIEVKSMVPRWRTVMKQINKHITRLRGGLYLGAREWPPQDVCIATHRFVRVVVQPSTWKLSREYRHEKLEGRVLRRAIFRPNSAPEVIVFPEPTPPSQVVQIEEIESGLWNVTLPWSQEALAHAAFEMTFWYMGQIGRQVYANKPIPQGWDYMALEEVGFNSIKRMLYEAILRPLKDREYKRAMWLYNIYCYGYPIGADSKDVIYDLKELQALRQSGKR